jgi:predicted Zn-ribbon and HTH transcriptional regulator
LNNAQVIWSKVFNDGKCPACGSTERLSEKLFESDIEKGTVDKDQASIAIKVLQDQRQSLGLTAKVMVLYQDACLDCGVEFYWKAELQKIPVTAMPQNPGNNQGLPPFMGKG